MEKYKYYIFSFVWFHKDMCMFFGVDIFEISWISDNSIWGHSFFGGFLMLITQQKWPGQIWRAFPFVFTLFPYGIHIYICTMGSLDTFSKYSSQFWLNSRHARTQARLSPKCLTPAGVAGGFPLRPARPLQEYLPVTSGGGPITKWIPKKLGSWHVP